MTLQEFMKQRNATATLSWEFNGNTWSHEIRMQDGTAQFFNGHDWMDEVEAAYRDCTNVQVQPH